VKYGIRDYRGGGRSSARETAMRVAAGAIARKVVPGMIVRGALVQMGPHKIDRGGGTGTRSATIPFFCPDAKAARMRFGRYLDGIRKSRLLDRRGDGDRRRKRAGGSGRADLRQARRRDLAAALMSINAVKGVEIGEGFAAAELSGEENADEMRAGQ
jgi:chorismate synthase